MLQGVEGVRAALPVLKVASSFLLLLIVMPLSPHRTLPDPLCIAPSQYVPAAAATLTVTSPNDSLGVSLHLLVSLCLRPAVCFARAPV